MLTRLMCTTLLVTAVSMTSVKLEGLTLEHVLGVVDKPVLHHSAELRFVLDLMVLPLSGAISLLLELEPLQVNLLKSPHLWRL